MISSPGRWCSARECEDIMKTRYTVALSMLAGADVAKELGGHYIARTDKITALDGAAPERQINTSRPKT